MEARALQPIPVFCPTCQRDDLTPTDFGICRARSSGRNLYCKKCCREKMARARQELRARKALVSAGLLKLMPPKFKLVPKLRTGPDPSLLVRQQFQPGTRQTFASLVQGTRLSKDLVSDALTQLLLWDRTLETKIENGERVYRLRSVPVPPVKNDG